MIFTHRYRIVVFDFERKRFLQRTIQLLLCRQSYHVRHGNWSRVVDIDVQLHVLRSELYGVGYCGF